MSWTKWLILLACDVATRLSWVSFVYSSVGCLQVFFDYAKYGFNLRVYTIGFIVSLLSLLFLPMVTMRFERGSCNDR